ncbi:Na(+)/H(+) exchange regulatory cofactor NHE-RF1 [Corythoichthys intestinalis]|uniref:Na(+)/H(+) exchange regulatory cofactor NHE-RF1 n=1 Tax=Corythoichthys intestinalis TaxID=161448 RepID=UPI0025A617C4|nr:Na(+)/H(+) exchange regulatory cofactor NHE-RF1 [Corythoichthys intestinalis]XP_061805250.1 Na(+)/H(+) exchange regulatory cofactor NHE-RF1-like [Nerophis lumbriciformis]
MPSKNQYLRPRLCTLDKGDNGYGFHLHGEKGKTGQFIRLVEPDSPAESSGLRAGDRLVFVNGDDVENESHQQVVSRIRATSGRLELIVVDPDTEQLLKKHNIKCLKEYVNDGIPLPFEEEEEKDREEKEEEEVKGTENGDERRSEEVEAEEERGGGSRGSTPVPDSNGEIHADVERKLSVNSDKEVIPELRPRLCVIRREANGYGFNLHSERARPGQYIRAVDENSPAERAGLQPKDRIVQVNGVPVEGKTHSEVVATIKAGGDEARLLVVDPATDDFFKRCRVVPTSDHLTGPLPEPGVNGGMEEKVNGRGGERDSKMSVSPSPSNASSNASLTSPTTSTPPEGTGTEGFPALNMSLQQVKELAHQKRSNKRAPAMDWTKKNELFSNL